MPIGPGSRVGPYEVVGLLGQGGMGQVWRARHLALKRDDALKVLPEAFAADSTRLARLRREAEVLALLNHANIAQIHGLEEAGGASVLVMELVEGLTLADRIAAGPLALDESLSIARQIARGLEAAHEKGLVHRDLKPANVNVRRDGTVKLLDFGLARGFDVGTAGAVDESTQSLTADGAVVGTPAYMSPEQARGEPVDARADVWAFGCVLFEMLTGRRAFDVLMPAATAAGYGTGPDWSSLPEATPRSVRWLLRRCLARDLQQRVKHMSAALLVLEESEALSTGDGAGPAAKRSGRRWMVAAGVVAALAAIGLAAGVWKMVRSDPPATMRTIVADPLLTASDRSFAFLPDGRFVYLSRDARRILVRSIDALDPVPLLTTAAYVRGPFPSPDGRWLGFFENAFTLKKVATTGGPEVAVLQTDGPSRGAAWGPDDSIVFATANTETGLQRVAGGGGPATVLTRPDADRGELDHLQPSWLPGGRGLLFTITARKGGLEAARVAVLERESGTWRTLVEGGYAARYVDSGHLVYAARGALWAVRFDITRLALAGDPVEVLARIPGNSLGHTVNFDVAADGTLAYPRDARSDSEPVVPVWVDREGRETALPASPGSYRHPRLSPDSRRLAVAALADLFVWRIDRPFETASRITFTPGFDWFPVWTPDGRRLVFGSWRGGRFSNLYTQDADGGETERLTESPDMQMPTSLSPDGSTIVFHSVTRSLEALHLDGRGRAERQVPLVDTPFEERNGSISSDGRWLAYEGESPTRPGLVDIYVRPFPDVNRGMWQVSRDGGTYPTWAMGGRELYYAKLDGTLVAVPVEATGPPWRNGTPKDLFRGPYLLDGDGSVGRQYDVTPDGQRFVMLKFATQERAPHFVLVQNWTSELRRRTGVE